jgi:hypothetical protein
MSRIWVGEDAVDDVRVVGNVERVTAVDLYIFGVGESRGFVHHV